ncbi:MAG: histidinol-phosphate transaminase [Gammaproteobacteria bacterium]|nr:histidinol-phosphate transaminase [Gammaproteobacteria bacterium]
MNFVRSAIRDMSGYVYGEQPDDRSVMKLNTNENPYPPSPRVREIFQSLDPANLRIYPEATARALRESIAARNHLQPEQVVVTNGADEAIRLLFSTFMDHGEIVSTTEPGYSLYGVFAEIQEATIVRTDLSVDWQLPPNVGKTWNQNHVKLSVLVNPHAPCGTYFPELCVRQLLSDFDGILVLDEAYIDFVDPEISYSSAKLLNEFPNLLILRTFSKGYSLAGMRVGYILGSQDLLDPIMNKTRDSYNVDAVAQRIAQCVFEDHSYAQSTHEKVRSQRSQMENAIRQLGFRVPPSQANFLLVEHPEYRRLDQLVEIFKEHKILVRYFDTPRLNHAIRLTIGTPEQNQEVLKVLQLACNH